jgi:hypothetical protein
MADLTVTSTRIKANALHFEIDGDDYWADFSAVSFQSEDAAAEVTTFYDASQGGGKRDFYFTVSGVQSTATGSFWKAMWDAAGDEVAFVYAPHGNDVASATEPHITGTVRIPAKGSFILGGEASSDGTFSFDGVRMDVVGEPVYDVTA